MSEGGSGAVLARRTAHGAESSGDGAENGADAHGACRGLRCPPSALLRPPDMTSVVPWGG